MARRFIQFLPLGLLALVAACATGPSGPQVPVYVVFFTPFSSELDADAQTVVADASRAATTAPGRTVTVAGYANPTPAPGISLVLSQQRAKTVADALAAAGVRRDRITIAPRGTTGGDPGIESRRVEILFP